MKKYIRELLFALLSVFLGHSVFAASSELGVVLMHGKWGSPWSMLPLARDLESRGYLVSNPEMAWSGRRVYDVEYPAALNEIEQQVHELRACAISCSGDVSGRTRPIFVLGRTSGSS